MGFIRFNWPSVKHTISVFYLVHFCHIRQGWHKGDFTGGGGGSKTIQPLYSPCNLLSCFGKGLCLGPGVLRAIIDISSKHHFSKKKLLRKPFLTVLSWCDLAVTLRWPYHDLGVTPIWSSSPTHVTMCTWVGARTDLLEVLAIGSNINFTRFPWQCVYDTFSYQSKG